MSDLLKRADALNERVSLKAAPSAKAKQAARAIKKLLDQAVQAGDTSLLDRTDALMRDLRRELQGGSSIDYNIASQRRSYDWSDAPEVTAVVNDPNWKTGWASHEKALVKLRAGLEDYKGAMDKLMRTRGLTPAAEKEIKELKASIEYMERHKTDHWGDDYYTVFTKLRP